MCGLFGILRVRAGGPPGLERRFLPFWQIDDEQDVSLENDGCCSDICTATSILNFTNSRRMIAEPQIRLLSHKTDPVS